MRPDPWADEAVHWEGSYCSCMLLYRADLISDNFLWVRDTGCLVQVFVTARVRRGMENLAGGSSWLYLCKAGPPRTR